MKSLRSGLLTVICLALLLFCGCVSNPESGSSGKVRDPSEESVYASRSADEVEEALNRELQAALDAKEAKQIWAADFFSETRREARLWHYTVLDCAKHYPELQTLLFPEAKVTKKQATDGDGSRLELKLDRAKLTCIFDTRNVRFTGLTAKQFKELFPKATDWAADLTGLELREWTGFDRNIISAYCVYTGAVDGIPIGAMTFGRVSGKLEPGHGLWLSSTGMELRLPISVGEEAGTVKLFDRFSPEELRMTAEFNFDPSSPVVEVYRSCELCYLIHEQKELLVPAWWVKGTRYDYETGKKTAFEMVFDAETGSIYTPGG